MKVAVIGAGYVGLSTALIWAVGPFGGGVSWIPTNLPLVALGGLKELEAVGVFRAASNLFMPVLHFQTALNALFSPHC
jgi:O-antigen/teichoic acid export membrane protein